MPIDNTNVIQTLQALAAMMGLGGQMQGQQPAQPVQPVQPQPMPGTVPTNLPPNNVYGIAPVTAMNSVLGSQPTYGAQPQPQVPGQGNVGGMSPQLLQTINMLGTIGGALGNPNDPNSFGQRLGPATANMAQGQMMQQNLRSPQSPTLGLNPEQIMALENVRQTTEAAQRQKENQDFQNTMAVLGHLYTATKDAKYLDQQRALTEMQLNKQLEAMGVEHKYKLTEIGAQGEISKDVAHINAAGTGAVDARRDKDRVRALRREAKAFLKANANSISEKYGFDLKYEFGDIIALNQLIDSIPITAEDSSAVLTQEALEQLAETKRAEKAESSRGNQLTNRISKPLSSPVPPPITVDPEDLFSARPRR